MKKSNVKTKTLTFSFNFNAKKIPAHIYQKFGLYGSYVTNTTKDDVKMMAFSLIRSHTCSIGFKSGECIVKLKIRVWMAI